MFEDLEEKDEPLNKSTNDKVVWRTAQATPGQLKMELKFVEHKVC